MKLWSIADLKPAIYGLPNRGVIRHITQASNDSPDTKSAPHGRVREKEKNSDGKTIISLSADNRGETSRKFATSIINFLRKILKEHLRVNQWTFFLFQVLAVIAYCSKSTYSFSAVVIQSQQTGFRWRRSRFDSQLEPNFIARNSIYHVLWKKNGFENTRKIEFLFFEDFVSWAKTFRLWNFRVSSTSLTWISIYSQKLSEKPYALTQ